MKKYFLGLSVFLTMNLYAASTEDFFYNRGYEAGHNAGFEAGVKMAFEEAKNVLMKYEQELQAYEIGKYLIRSGNLTYPQVFQETTDDGTVRLRVTNSKIERMLNIDELFYKFATIPVRPSKENNPLELTLAEKNSVVLSVRDSNTNSLPQRVSERTNTRTLSLAKNSKNLEILKKANVVFSDEGGAYNVLFFTDTERSSFCKEYQICSAKTNVHEE